MFGLPPTEQILNNAADFEGIARMAGGPEPNVNYYQAVTPDYFGAMGISVVAGRAFQPGDGRLSPPVVIINQTLARTFYAGQDPIGRRIRPTGTKEWFTVVGVGKDVKQGGLDSNTGTELYMVYAQTPLHFLFTPSSMNVVVRSRLATAALAPSIQQVVRATDATVPIVGLRTMDEVFAESASRTHFIAVLLGIFASVALLLAAIGTYGVLGYAVAERQREIGIRLALGATSQRVLTMVLSEGMTLTSLGLSAGLVGAAALTRVAASLLFGVSATDPATFAAVAVLLVVAALAACVVPAFRAARTDPLLALRAD